MYHSEIKAIAKCSTIIDGSWNLIEIYQNSFMLRFHVMICDRRSKIEFIIYYNNKCPTGYTIKLRYTDAWYDYVIKGTDARL